MSSGQDQDAPPVLEREIKEELIDSDELQDSDVSQNLMNELMKRINGAGSSSEEVVDTVDDNDDPFPPNFGVSNLAPRPQVIQAKLFGRPPPLITTISKNSRGPHKGNQPIAPYVPDRRYTLPPAKPKPPRGNAANVVGSNTSLGPLRILAERHKELHGQPYKKVSALEAYNGGRPGERFKPMSSSEISGFFNRMASTSSAKRNSSIQDQPTVRMAATEEYGTETKKVPVKRLRLARTPKNVGVQEKEEEELRTPKAEMDQSKDLPAQIKIVAETLTKEPSTQDVLMSSMVMNALTTLKTRDNGDHAEFSSEIFGLLFKYGIQ